MVNNSRINIRCQKISIFSHQMLLLCQKGVTQNSSQNLFQIKIIS